MLSFFGQFETEKELEAAMVNSFRANPEKYLRTLAKRVIAQDIINAAPIIIPNRPQVTEMIIWAIP